MTEAGVSAVVVIPARYDSRRLPGKPLLDRTGLPLVVHVLRRAEQAKRVSRVIVATDDERIVKAVTRAGGEAVLTAGEHTCGTERVGEVADLVPEARFFVNLQGDEPEMAPEDIDRVVGSLEAEPGAVATLAAPIEARGDLEDPAVVKVVVDSKGTALYFSRSPIPYDREGAGRGEPALRHIGIYGFSRETLDAFRRLPPSPLERTEKLEQLRALQAGIPIRVIVVSHAPAGIDTRESYDAFVRRASASGAGEAGERETRAGAP